MPSGISLHIGVNVVDPSHYAGWSGILASCEADAQDLRAIARACGFASTILRTGAATRETVIGGIEAAGVAEVSIG